MIKLKSQLNLLDPKKKQPIDEMKRINKEYEKDRKMLGDFKFSGQLSELKNKQTETLNFIVSGEVVRKFEALKIA